MSLLTSGRTEPCKDSAGGLKEIYLSAFTEYDEALIAGIRDSFITNYPTTLVHKFEGVNKTFEEQINEEGFNSQTISMRLTHQDVASVLLLKILSGVKVLAVIVDCNGLIRMCGITTGMDVEISAQSGGNRADFNGYELKITGVEEFFAPEIGALTGSGVEKGGVTFGCLLGSSDKLGSLVDLTSSCNIAQ